MGLWIRLAVLLAVLCAVAEINQAQESQEENILDLAGINEGGPRRRPSSGPPRRGGPVAPSARRPPPSRRFGKGRFSHLSKGRRFAQARAQFLAAQARRSRFSKPQRPNAPRVPQKPRVHKPQLPKAPAPRPQLQQRPQTRYGSVNFKPSSGLSGKFRYAQTAPVAKPVQPSVKVQQRPAAARSEKSLSVSMPTLANLLYKYAAASTKSSPFFKSNPYSMISLNGYGPMPLPSGYTPQHRQQTRTYQPAQVPSNQQPKPHGYQQPSYTAYQSPVVQQQVVTVQRPRDQKSYYSPPPAAPTCPAAGNFCYGKKAGHYTHPGSRACFIQCDAFGRGYAKGCSPGTSWKAVGPEPALWNMCS